MTLFVMIAPWIMGIVKSVPATFQKNIGIAQYIKGSELAKKPRPIYVRPDEIKQMVSMARTQAAQVGLPGEAQTQELLEADVANVIREASRTGDPNAFLEAVSAATSKKSQATQQLAIAAARNYEIRQERLMAALQVGAEESRREFDINLYKPYLAAQAAASALKQAGLENVQAGVKGISEAWAGGGGMMGGGGGASGGGGGMGNIPFR